VAPAFRRLVFLNTYPNKYQLLQRNIDFNLYAPSQSPRKGQVLQMYETLVIAPTVLSLFVTVALEFSDSRFDARRFARQRIVGAQRLTFTAKPAADHAALPQLQKAA